MATLYDNAVPIVNLPFLYINEAVVSNNVTTPNTVLNLSAGIMRDSTNTYDLNIGNFNGQVNQSATPNVVTNINCAINGLNGLDTGSLTASKLYYIYVVSDPVSGMASGAMASLAAPSVGPLLPFGYSVFRHVGYAVTDASVHFLLFYQGGNNNARVFNFDAPQATAVTAGNATSFTAINLAAWVPPVENNPVSLAYAFTPGAASRVLNLTPGNATGNAVTITGQVTSVVMSGNAEVMSKVTSSVPEVDYKVTNSGDAVAVNVAGFKFFI